MTVYSLTLFDVVALAICIFALLIYHVVFYAGERIHLNADYQLSFKIRNVSHWLHKHKEKSDPQSMTLAIHTLRNTIIVGVFVGGYALTIAYTSVANYQATENKYLQVRGIMIAILLFGSFLCWANAIRYAAHLGYLIGILDYVDKTDLELLERLPDHENGANISITHDDDANKNHSTNGLNIETKSEVQVSERIKLRVERYPYDRKVVMKRCEYLLRMLLFSFR